MRKYRGSHEDFDYFVIPTVPALKQQQDTIATLAELARIGIPAVQAQARLQPGRGRRRPVARPSSPCSPSYGSIPSPRPTRSAGWEPTRSSSEPRASRRAWPTWRTTTTDYKALIAKAKDTAEKVALARKLATVRLASGVVPELDECFAALELT